MVIQDPTALWNWSAVVDYIVAHPTDVLRIKKLLNECAFSEAVLVTLQRWESEGDEPKQLWEVFRRYGFNSLADKYREYLQRNLQIDVGPDPEENSDIVESSRTITNVTTTEVQGMEGVDQ